MKSSCVRVAADNSAVKCRYYVRLSAADLGNLPLAEREDDGDLVRGVTENMSVSAMHAFAAALRQKGGSIFFAAMEG